MVVLFNFPGGLKSPFLTNLAGGDLLGELPE